jgi:hypothetical protein
VTLRTGLSRRVHGTKTALVFACARRFMFRAPNPEMLSMSRRLFAHRPAAPRCRGGASSLLRLSSAAAGGWPPANTLSDWAGRLARAADVAHAPSRAPALDPHPQWLTHLAQAADRA